MPRPRGSTSHPGTRSGGPVRRGGKTYYRGPAKIARPQSRPQLVRTRKRHRNKPLLLAAGLTAGAGALTALLTGRWGAAFVLVGFAAGLGITHLAWQHHQRRVASRPARAPRGKRDPQTGRKPPKAVILTDARAKAYGPGWKAGDKMCSTHQGARDPDCATCRTSGGRPEPKTEPKVNKAQEPQDPPRADLNGHYQAAASVAHGTRALR